MASAPAHVSNTAATAITKQVSMPPFTLLAVMADMVQTSGCLPQKLLQNIQLKEQQKLLEQQLAVHLGQNPELLAQALKGVIPVSH